MPSKLACKACKPDSVCSCSSQLSCNCHNMRYWLQQLVQDVCKTHPHSTQCPSIVVKSTCAGNNSTFNFTAPQLLLMCKHQSLLQNACHPHTSLIAFITHDEAHTNDANSLSP
jgi:hypothetical protein